MQLEIITPDKKLFKGEASAVQLPGTDGSFQVLNNHAPVISSLKEGVVKVDGTSEGTKTFDINGGVIEMQDNKIIILAE